MKSKRCVLPVRTVDGQVSNQNFWREKMESEKYKLNNIYLSYFFIQFFTKRLEFIMTFVDLNDV